jgi:hypothetical protein
MRRRPPCRVASLVERWEAGFLVQVEEHHEAERLHGREHNCQRGVAIARVQSDGRGVWVRSGISRHKGVGSALSCR